MKYLKYYEGKTNINFDAVTEQFNKHLDVLGIKVTKRLPGTLNVRSMTGFTFNFDFMCIPFSILHISTMIFPVHDSMKTASPYIQGESLNFIRSLDYSVQYNFKPYTEEGIYDHFYEKIIEKFTNFNNTLFMTMNAGANGNLNYLPFDEDKDEELIGNHIDCKAIILEYLNANKKITGEVIIPQSSIDMVKYVINIFRGNQHKLAHNIQQNNPLLYEKIKDKNTDDAAGMHDMGFSD